MLAARNDAVAGQTLGTAGRWTGMGPTIDNAGGSGGV